jgi:hypothetical protein
MTDPAACATCPLAANEPAERSAYLGHLLYVDELIQTGAHFLYEDIPAEDWRALIVLRRKRNEKQIAEMKKK